MTLSYICVDTINPELALKTLEFCKNQFDLPATLLTNKPYICKYIDIIQIPSIKSIEDYSKFMCLELHKYISTEKVITIQTDGYVLNPQAWLDEFLEYDYIGAPWTVGYNKHPDFPDCVEATTVGNGGFSLRSKKLCKAVAKLILEGNYKYHPEDLAICRGIRPYLDALRFKFAPREVACKWAAEDNIYQEQFGFHGRITMGINKIPYLNGNNITVNEALRKQHR